MKQPDDHIKKRFSDFEPEVNEASINDAWEKVSYFLPQEKKRRPAVYFIRYIGAGCLLLLLLAMPLMLHHYKATGAGSLPQKQVAKANAKHEAVIKDAAQGAANNKNDLQPNAPRSRTAFAANAGGSIGPAPGAHYKTHEALANKTPLPGMPTATAGFTSQVIHNEEQGFNAGKYNNGIASGKQTDVEPVQANDTTGIVKASHYANDTKHGNDDPAVNAEDSSDQLHNSGQAATAHLPLYHYNALALQTPPDSINTTMPVAPLLRGPAAKGALSLQAFGGLNVVSTGLQDLSYATEKRYNRVQASAGLALSYRFINKVSVMGQLVFSAHSVSYGHVLTQAKITSKLPPISLALAGDTIIKYVDAYTTTSFKSAASYNAAFGMGYRLFKRGPLDLDVFALVSLRAVRYRFSRYYTLGAEEHSYHTGAPPALALAPAGFPGTDQYLSKTVVTGGMIAGISLCYTVYKNTGIIFRPSYCLQMPGSKGSFHNLFVIRQNALYLDLGIRMKL